MRKFRTCLMTLGFCLAVCSFSEAAASDPYYLNGDKNYPMIQNTGGIYNDGTTGLFLDLSTVTIEDVFEDGLAARVKLMNLVSNKETGEAWVHVRFDVDGRVWAQRTDGKWSEVSKNFDDPAALAVMFVREEMGDDARRSVLTSQISKIMASKKEALGKTAPSDDAKLPAADGGVKRKGEVVKSSSTDVSQKNTPAAEDSSKGPSRKEGSAGKNEKPSENPDAAKKQDDISDVKVTITEAPKVEIVKTPPVQVDITPAPPSPNGN